MNFLKNIYISDFVSPEIKNVTYYLLLNELALCDRKTDCRVEQMVLAYA